MIYSSLERINVYHGRLSQVFGFVPTLTEGFSNQAEVDTFLDDHGIDSTSYLQLLQNLGYTNQGQVDAAMSSGTLTKAIIYTAFAQL